MNEQRDLFDQQPVAAHLDDPATSRKAATTHGVAVHRRLVFGIATEWPGLTASRISELAGERHADQFAKEAYQRLCQVRKRLSDLKKSGHLYRGDPPEGVNEVTWFPTGKKADE